MVLVLAGLSAVLYQRLEIITQFILVQLVNHVQWGLMGRHEQWGLMGRHEQ